METLATIPTAPPSAGRLARGALAVMAALPLLAALGSASSRAADFKEYINADGFKHYRSALFLGMFNSQADADAYKAARLADPLSLKPYDVIFAFGMSGNEPWVKAWEVTRVAGDNLSFSPLTNYGKAQGLAFEQVFGHSNGNDVLANLLKTGSIRAHEVIAMAPPAGFLDEARTLPVSSVRIFRTKDDPVAEVLGKATLFGLFQKLGDLDIGLVRQPGSDQPLLGARIRIALPDGTPGPKITDTRFEGPAFFADAGKDSPHDLTTHTNNIILQQMYRLHQTLNTADPSLLGPARRQELENKLTTLQQQFPEASKKFGETLRAFPEPAATQRVTTQGDGGVSLEMEIRESSFKKDPSGRLGEPRKEAAKSRPNPDSLSWPVPRQGGGR